jgi:hypothetical protein
MKRYKWFRVGVPIDFRVLLRRLNRLPFLADTDSGFHYVAGDGGRVRFRYLRRVKVIVGVLDELGSPATQVIDSVESFEFELVESVDTVLVRIDEPPRSIKSLLDSFERVCGGGLAVVLVTFPFESHRLMLSGLKSSRLVALKGAGADHGRKYVARVEVASREGIVLEQLTVLSGLEFSIENSTYEVMTDQGRGQVAFLSSGVVRFGDQIADNLLASVESYLLNDCDEKKGVKKAD